MKNCKKIGFVCREGLRFFIASFSGVWRGRVPLAVVAACAIHTAYPVEMSVTNVAGVPRFAVNGKPMAATAVMPSPAGKPGEALPVLKTFADVGIRLASDVWTMHDRRYNPRQWWIDEGVYDFEQFDAIVRGLIKASPEELFFPRIKIDPPDRWSDRHPEEIMKEDMIPGRSVRTPRPESAAWRKLYRGMIKDMIEHVEKSDYADRVLGYHIGAFHCGEWLTYNNKGTYPEAKCDPREAFAPSSDIGDRRRSVSERSNAVADMLIDAASCVKECTGGRKLVCAFFGYNSVAHEKVSRVLRSGKIDFIAAPPHYYEHREVGKSGRSQTYYQASYRLHNTVYFEESDYRTFLSDPNFAPKSTRRRPLDEAVALIRRSIGKSLAGGWENWWFLIGGNNSYSAPEMMESIRVGAAENAATMMTAQWKPAEVAVFTAADEYVTSGGGTHIRAMANWCKGAVHRDIMPFAGAPFDSYELADIDDERLPDYKVYVFPNVFTLSEDMRAKIKAVVRRTGKTAIWFCAPGYYDGHGGESVERVKELTGVDIEFRPLGEDRPCRRTLAPTGSAFCEQDGWRSIFMAEPPPPSVMRGVLCDAGVHIWLDSDDVLAAGRGYVMVHASSDGEKKIKLPAKLDCKEIFGASPALKGVCEITMEMKRGETRVWKLR